MAVSGCGGRRYLSCASPSHRAQQRVVVEVSPFSKGLPPGVSRNPQGLRGPGA